MFFVGLIIVVILIYKGLESVIEEIKDWFK